MVTAAIQSLTIELYLCTIVLRAVAGHHARWSGRMYGETRERLLLHRT